MSTIFSILLLILAIIITVQAQNTIITVTVNPATVITTGEMISFAASAQTATTCTYQYSLMSSPVPPTSFPPVITITSPTTVDINGMNFPGLYVFTVTATCQGIDTVLNLNVRALGGTYDTATIRAAIDAIGTFGLNGVTTPVNGFIDGQTLTTALPVAPNDVFTLIGRNAVQSVSPNPAMVAATIRWRDMDFNTDPATWKCTTGNLTASTGSTAWMKTGFNTALPAAVSQGSNIVGSPWAKLNNNAIIQVAPEAQFLWTTSTLNLPATDVSIVSCRSVFTPPAEIVTGLTVVTNAVTTTAPTTAPTTTTTATTAPTNPPTTIAPTVPATTTTTTTVPATTTTTQPTTLVPVATAAPIVNPTTPPTIPATNPPVIVMASSSSTGVAVAVPPPVNGAGQAGAGVGNNAAAAGGGGNKVNPVFIAVPIVIVVALIGLYLIIRQRRKATIPSTPITKLSEQV